MRVDWQIKPSVTGHSIILFTATLPVIFSMLAQQSLGYVLMIFLVSLILLTLLLKENQDVISQSPNNLSWQDGNWFYANERLLLEGKLANQSFNLGLMLLLIIEDEQGQVVRLWLFPDSLEINSSGALGWRQLSSCFHLSA